MPEVYIGISLSSPCLRDGMRRRTVKCPVQVGDTILKADFLSWSWTGWVGRIYYTETFGCIDAPDAELVYYVVRFNGNIELLHGKRSSRQSSYFPYNSIHKVPNPRWREIKTEILLSEIPHHLLATDVAPKLLIFYTSYVTLDINVVS